MQLKAKVSRDFNQKSAADKVSFGANVILQLTTNGGTFPNLPFTVVQLQAANDDLQDKWDAFQLQGAIAEGAFLESDAIWESMFSKTGLYVEIIADGSIAIINLSGFKFTKTESTPAVRPDSPDSDMVGGSVKGTVTATAKPVKGAKGFIFGMATPDFEITRIGDQIIAKLGNSFISFIVGTKRSVKFENLPSHLDVEGAAAAFNSAGIGDFNDHDVSIP